MKNLIVHTQNSKRGDSWIGTNYRFQEHYYGEYDNTDRLTIVGVPNEEAKELSIGISFCTYPDNFSRLYGTYNATLKAENYYDMVGGIKYKPYAVIEITEVEFTQEACLNVLYAIHDELIKLSVKEVKRLVNQQIVK